MSDTLFGTRLIRATRDEIFAAFENPERLARWWGPFGFTNDFREFAFREGGDWRFDMVGPDGRRYPNESRFVKIDPPAAIVIEHLGSMHHFFLTITLAEEVGRTRIGWEMRFDSEEDCGRVLPYAPRCNEENFDRLEAELDRGRTAEIAAIIRGWHDALERRDLDAMIGGYAADAVIFDVKPPWTIAGPRALRQMWEACLPFFPEEFRIETQDLAVHRSGDLAVAHWVQRIMVERDPAHPAAQTCLRATVTLRRDGDCWLSVHDHVSVPFDPASGRAAFTLQPDTAGP